MVRFVGVSLLISFTYVFLANAWMGDDAYITFRAAWNLAHGYGFTYNPAERVQAFTNPLWAILVTGSSLLTGDFFFTVTVLSWALSLAAGVLLLRRVRGWHVAAVTVFWLLSSKALVDYSSSGLEYPLSYFLLALFYSRYLGHSGTPPTPSQLRWYVLVASLAFVNRPDSVLLYALPLAEMLFAAARAHRVNIIPAGLAGSAPALAWLSFATFYYGFPLPNTYYAKVANGIPGFIRREQGVAYLFNSIRYDPITIATIALAVLLFWRKNGPARWAAFSALLSVGYSVDVGGDFMGGRFFALPFLLAVAVLTRDLAAPLARPAAAGLVIYNLLVPVVPIKTLPGHQAGWPWRTQNGIKDEMGISHADSNLLGYAPFRLMPDFQFGREGLSFRASSRKVAVYPSIGLFGFNAGPEKHVVDSNALSDPLLARLPVSPLVFFDFWASHYFRDLPPGYIESIERDQNLLTDPLLRDYYEKLRHVTRGPLFSTSRLRDIWELNAGHSRRVGETFAKRRPVVLSIRAGHWRFQTDVGERDRDGVILRSTGREGYLQSGPGIPMKAGAYRARWKGAVTADASGHLGRVEVWADDHLVSCKTVNYEGGNADRDLVSVDFTIPRDVRRLEYRFWVSATAPVVLERIELLSASALEPGR